jgi:dTDP-4-dehydrorhamnose reductase
MKPRLLVIGATGFVGSHWSVAARRELDVWRGSRAPGDGPNRVAIDVTDPASVAAAFAAVRPRHVTLLAALSDINRCQREQGLAELINFQGAINVARECARCDARLLFTSSDAVFDGTKGIYHENEPPTPPNWYGQTKARAEQAIAKILSSALIARLSLVLGRSATLGGNSYLEKVLANLRAGHSVVAPTYEVRNPIDVATLCEFLLTLTCGTDATGIVHVGASDKITRYDLVREIARRAGADESLVVAANAPSPGSVLRGKDDFLATERLCSLSRTSVPTCQQVIDRAMAVAST